MGIYTVYDDPKIDNCIASHLSTIVTTIRRELPEVGAIILAGGFGRGEGSVLLKDDKVIPVNDYDIVLATHTMPNHYHLVDLASQLAQSIGIQHIDLIPIPISDFASLPANQFNYDLKYGSKALWGEDILAVIPPITPSAITLDSACRLLINRSVCLLEGFPQCASNTTAEYRFFTFNQTVKTALACGEALLIQKGLYSHSYATRRKLVNSCLSNRSDLLLLHNAATDFKLRPVMEPPEDLSTFWDNTVGEYNWTLCDIVLGPKNQHPGWRSLVRCLNQLIQAKQIDTIEHSELALIFAAHVKGWQKQALILQAQWNLGITGYLFTSWDHARQATVAGWHTLHP
jgi:hypothetical protein